MPLPNSPEASKKLLPGSWANVTGGGVSCYIRKADAMDGLTNLETLGLLHITLSPNPFEDGTYFNQTLHLATASLSVHAGGSSLADHKVAFELRVQAGSNRLSIGITSSGDKYSLTAYLDPVRPFVTPNATTPQADRHAVLASAEEVDSAGAALAGIHSLVYYIRNLRGNVSRPTFVQRSLEADAVPELASVTPDYWTNSQTGIVVRGHASDGGPLKRIAPATLLSDGAASAFELSVDSLTRVTPSSAAWIKATANLKGESMATTAAAHEAFWRQFWQRSYIDLGAVPGNEPDCKPGIPPRSTSCKAGIPKLSAMYQITRFVQAVQSRTMWPIKFNSMLFSASRFNQTAGYSPDNRNWGPTNDWQNLRLPCEQHHSRHSALRAAMNHASLTGCQLSDWSMFASGDWDTLETVFKYYKNMYVRAGLRSLRLNGKSHICWCVQAAASFAADASILQPHGHLLHGDEDRIWRLGWCYSRPVEGKLGTQRHLLAVREFV